MKKMIEPFAPGMPCPFILEIKSNFGYLVLKQRRAEKSFSHSMLVKKYIIGIDPFDSSERVGK